MEKRDALFGQTDAASTTAERELDDLRKGANPELLKVLTNTKPALTKSEQAARDAAAEKYRQLQKDAHIAQQQRAEAAKPRYSEQEIADAAAKIRSVKMGLTEETRNFGKLLFDQSHVGHQSAAEEWREWNKIASSAKK